MWRGVDLLLSEEEDEVGIFEDDEVWFFGNGEVSGETGFR